jgi:transposase
MDEGKEDHEFSPEARHHILLDYIPGVRGHGAKAVAHRHGVKSHQTILNWYERWDRTPSSLKDRDRSGAPPLTIKAQAKDTIANELVKAHLDHRAISYTAISDTILRELGEPVSTRTLRSYGRQLGASCKSTIPRMDRERTYYTPNI